MITALNHDRSRVLENSSSWEENYRPLPFLFFGLSVVWVALAGVWTANTWSKRRWHTNNLQWVLAAVPVLKTLVLGLSFVFWYSCLNLSSCLFWVAFGVFVSRIFFETACFAAFLLIAYGYCIMHEQLSLSDRRSIAGLASLLYLTLTGYKADVPQFVVLVALMYMLLLYVIFVRISQNLVIMKEQLQYMQNEGAFMLQTAVSVKYSMFKKFQGAMFAIVASQILIHCRPDGVANEYWMWLVVREWTEIGILFYIGWTFRSRKMTPLFTVIPTCRPPDQRMFPKIYSVHCSPVAPLDRLLDSSHVGVPLSQDMNVKDFNRLNFKDWHIGVPTSFSEGRDVHWPVLVIVQNPGTAFSLNSKAIGPKAALPQMMKPRPENDGSLPLSQDTLPLVPSYSVQAGSDIPRAEGASVPVLSGHCCHEPSLNMTFNGLDSCEPNLQMDDISEKT